MKLINNYPQFLIFLIFSYVIHKSLIYKSNFLIFHGKSLFWLVDGHMACGLVSFFLGPVFWMADPFLDMEALHGCEKLPSAVIPIFPIF